MWRTGEKAGEWKDEHEEGELWYCINTMHIQEEERKFEKWITEELDSLDKARIMEEN